jgi:hypothetical protein
VECGLKSESVADRASGRSTPGFFSEAMMDDIEDLGRNISDGMIGEGRLHDHKSVVWKSIAPITTVRHDDSQDVDLSPYIENTESVFVRTWGSSIPSAGFYLLIHI